MNNSGITNFNVLNTNALYIRGLEVDFAGSNAYLQAEIDAIEQQLIPIEAITTRIDFTQQPLLIGDLVITEANKNSVLLTAIQNLQQSIGNINKLDLTQLPAAPPASCTITPTTTNQALKALIDTNTGDITTIQGQITSINTSIGAINAKLAHFSTFTYGADTMSGIADGTGFAVAVSGGSQSGNGLFVYPNNSAQTAQIELETEYGKEIFIRGGSAVKIYGGNDGSITSRNKVELGDKTDVIKIGTNNGGLVDFPEVEIGVDGTLSVTRDSSTTIKGDLYFSRQVSSTGIYNVFPYTPVLVAETALGVDFGNCNKFTTDPTFSGLDVLATAGVAPITLTAGAGAIPITAAAGLISLTSLAGGITLATGLGVMTMNCGAGGLLINGGAGVINVAGGSAPINMTTIAGDITLGAGKGLGVTNSGNTILNADDNVIIQPDVATEIYKTAFVELNDNAAPPAVTANRLYQQADQLWFNGAQVSGGGGGGLPLTGGTLTGALNINYDAGQVTPQLQIINTNNSAPVGGQGGSINIRNDAAGTGSIGERCGKIDFSAKDSAGAGGRTYAAIQGYINDPTAAAIDGRLSQFVASNNTLTEFTRLISTSTGVRQVNINAQNTTIGTSALGSASTETLRVQGSAAITTTLDVPLIQNAPAIYPATSTTLVDNAVRQYQPERLYRLIDYPTPLSAPTTTGEKVIILNNTGQPSGIDSIIQASDFPTINGSALNAIIQVKYVDSTNFTPACNYVTALYNDGTINLFVQADTGGASLALTQIGRFVSAAGAVFVNDMVVTAKSNTNRIYAGGLFTSYQIPLPWGPAAVQANNFSNQIVVTWGGGTPNFTISNVSVNFMQSYACPEDGAGSIWGAVEGVNGQVTSVVNATSSSNFPQPSAIFDSIVIGGGFSGIGPTSGTPQRQLNNIAYYDYSNASGTSVNLFSQPTNQNTAGQFNTNTQVLGTFTASTTGNYYGLTCSIVLGYTGNLDPFSDPTANCVMQLRNNSNVVLAQSAQFGIVGIQIGQTQALTPEVQLVAGQNYNIAIFCSNFDTGMQPGDLTYSGIVSPPTPYCTLDATLSSGYIGWRTLSGSNWTTPVGPQGAIRGMQLLSSGYLGCAYDGTTITTSGGFSLTSHYQFGVFYMSGTATFVSLGSDDQLIQSGQAWYGYASGYGVNCVTGGNPVAAFGPGSIAYGEIYFCRGNFNAGGTAGVSYRPTSGDPYEPTDALIVQQNLNLTAYQLKPQFSSQVVAAVYRDDTKYQDVFWIARGTGNTLQTATLPFSGGVPNYEGISLPGGAILPCNGFGGYSDEVGYQGLLLQAPTNVYLYKGSFAGELVIDLSGCVVRCANNIYAQNKLTFPANEDGTSIMLVGDTSLVNPYGKPSWWAISQDGGIYYDNVLVDTQSGGGVTSAIAGTGIGVSSATGAVTISNTGVTEIVAGSNISISAGTGQVTINASIPASANGMIRFSFQGNPLINPNQHGVLIQNSGPGGSVSTGFVDFDFSTIVVQSGIAVSGNWTQGNAGIIWNGPNPINVQGQMCVDVSLYQQSGGNYVLMRFEDFNNQLQNHIAFGHTAVVLNSNGSNVNNCSSAFQFNMNQTNNNYYGSGAFMRALSGTFTFNTQMIPGQLLRVGCLGNIAWNNAAATATYQALFEAGSQASGYQNAGGLTLTINEMPFA